MAGGTSSPPINRAAFNMVVPGSTSTEMLTILTLNIFLSSAILIYFSFARKAFKDF
jgi:hypothetical protein